MILMSRVVWKLELWKTLLIFVDSAYRVAVQTEGETARYGHILK